MYDKPLKTIKLTPTSVQYWNENIDHLDEYVLKQIFLIPRSATIEFYTRYVFPAQNIKQRTLS